MGASLLACSGALAVALLAQATGSIRSDEAAYQNQIFQRWWNAELEWRFEALPESGTIPAERMPYSGHDYPDASGGTLRALEQYDRAFHPQTFAASRHEQMDIQRDKDRRVEVFGLFGLRTREVDRTPAWYGHCNGWAAAAIRHAEPQHNVVRNGVTFTPSDIKGLLAELYMYTAAEFLGGLDPAINPGLFHVVIGNWIGRGQHPVAIETALGREVWNYPAYAYAISHGKRGERQVEVKMNLAYADSTRMEMEQSPRLQKILYFHYLLDLDETGKITGGSYFADSAQLDMMWVPLAPIQGGTEGNEKGNPHLDAKEVLSIWRDSVPAEVRAKWLNIDPPEEDQVPLPGPDDAPTADPSTEDDRVEL